MNVVLVSPEVAPLAKVGGLADVAGALPLALHKLGETVSVVAPFYRSIDRASYRVRDTGVRVSVWMDGAFREGAVWEHRRKGVSFHLIESPDYFDREGIYGPPGGDFPDNPFRFGFFARAAIEAVRALELRPDVIHVNDWQTALLPVYQKVFYRDDPAVGGAGVVLSIHNLAYQGLFGKGILSRLGLPWDIFHLEAIEYYDQVNFLKGGLAFSEKITTVSPTYAREIQTPEFGVGLDPFLRKRAADLVGILNGIDTMEWNPARQDSLFERYSASRPTGKQANKRGLQKRLALARSPEAPLLGIISRLDPQKGLDLVLQVAPYLLAEGAQIALLGSGRREYLEAFRALKERFPDRLSLNEGYQEDLGRQIYAASDFFLMPSRFEPCGLGQMIALRYGSVPVVRQTGGLADTIVDADRYPKVGNGFVFQRYEPGALLDAVRRGLSHFEDRRSWRELVRRAMRCDYSWESSSRRYLDVYARAARRAGGGAR